MMIYDLLFTGPFSPEALTAALAEVFVLPTSEVDVQERSVEDRNWEAAALCTYEVRHGDVSATASLVTRDEVSAQPPAPELAGQLATRLGHPVLYPGTEILPSAFWLADGQRRPARIRLEYTEDVDPTFVEENEDEPSFAITAVDRPVPTMPWLNVTPIPEVIREHRMPTPLADAFADMNEQTVGDNLWHACSAFGAWEQFVARMAAGWPPDGWFPADFYAEYLEYRDEIDQYRAKLEPELASRLADAVRTIDEAYTGQTIDDGGTALAAELATPVTEIADRGPRWRRRPERLPWHLVE